MKSLCTLFLLFALGAMPMLAFAAPPEEIWQGSLDTGTIKLRIVFHIRHGENGSFTATLDSPDQGANGIPTTVTTYDAETLKLTVPAANGTFEGKLDKAGKTVTGNWSQGGTPLPLVLTKGGVVAVPKRPQTPQPPFPYDVEEVTFASKPGVTLSGTLTLPRGTKNRVPAVVMISGSGPNNRNEAILNHQIFWVIADYFTRQGIAVLRYDKRGIGQSKGNYAIATTADFADDAEAGFRFLQSHKRVDPKRVGLVGHSEGGVVAPMVAARNKEVAFIVMMAGTGLNGEQILYLQSALIAKAAGAKDTEIARQIKMQQTMFAIVKDNTDPTLAAAQMKTAVDTIWQAMTEAEKQELKTPEALSAQANALLSPWMRYFLTYDPLPALHKVHCPVLALNGSKDLQVPPKEDLSKIEAALAAGGNRSVTIRELPGLNHLFQTSTTGSPLEYGSIEETISPLALKTMGDWIAAHTKR